MKIKTPDEVVFDIETNTARLLLHLGLVLPVEASKPAPSVKTKWYVNEGLYGPPFLAAECDRCHSGIKFAPQATQFTWSHCGRPEAAPAEVLARLRVEQRRDKETVKTPPQPRQRFFDTDQLDKSSRQAPSDDEPLSGLF